MLLQWRSEGQFKGNMLDLDKRMFHDSTHSHYLTMPKGFTEKSLFENSMVCVAMGISVKSFMELCDESLDDLQVRTLIQIIQTEAKAKIWSLELVYCVYGGKKKDSFRHGIGAGHYDVLDVGCHPPRNHYPEHAGQKNQGTGYPLM